jgi:hypothetical protein
VSRFARSDACAVHRILRIAAFACYVGHGAFGIIMKAGWIPYFGALAPGDHAVEGAR